jgi:hypothetical protein
VNTPAHATSAANTTMNHASSILLLSNGEGSDPFLPPQKKLIFPPMVPLIKGIIFLCEAKKKPRASTPLLIGGMVEMVGFSFWGGKTRCAFDCNYLM